jgi:RHS repeat-associated protein
VDMTQPTSGSYCEMRSERGELRPYRPQNRQEHRQTTQTTLSGTPSDNRQQYTGRENDGTGLYYYRARYYHAGCARFISEDPIGWASGQTNNYAYVGGSPVMRRDPSGFSDIGPAHDLGLPTYVAGPRPARCGDGGNGAVGSASRGHYIPIAMGAGGALGAGIGGYWGTGVGVAEAAHLARLGLIFVPMAIGDGAWAGAVVGAVIGASTGVVIGVAVVAVIGVVVSNSSNSSCR